MILAPTRRPAPRATIQTARIPAPTGINTVVGGASMGETDALAIYNMVPGAYGLQVRSGWREWCTGLTGALGNGVRTMLPFTGSATNGSKDKLFAVTDTGIWDVTSSGVVGSGLPGAPSQVLTFSSSASGAGRGVATVVVTSAGHFMLYADERNGLFQYTESTDTWTQSAVTGVTEGIDTVAFVMVWKNRVFLVPRDSTKAYYLTAGAVTGAVAGSVNFAQRFKSGGSLVGLWSWTYDGGAGIDDSLVAVSQGGDVAIYQGTDPSAADAFFLKGVWQIGAVPAGRKIATDTGGDLLMISTLGAIPASKLVVGAIDSNQYATAKIANEFTRLMSLYRDYQGWSLVQHPGDGALLVTVPEYGPESNTNPLAMSFATGGWSKYRDLPVMSGCVWDGDFWFGTADGRIGRGVGYVDNVDIADSTSFDNIDWSLLTRYHNLDNASFKRVEIIRPILLSGQVTPTFNAAARYDYQLGEASEASGSGSGGSGAWDTGVWDTALWGADYVASGIISGASGMGRDVAVALRGDARSKTTLVGIDVMFNTGGPL